MTISLKGTLVLVGAGKMGGAMLEGWLKSGVRAEQVVALDPSPPPEILALLQKHHIRHNPAVATIKDAEVVLIAVKPQVMEDVLPGIVSLKASRPLVPSVAAGKTIAFARHFGADAAIIRTIPNTPAAVGRGITAMAANENVSKAQIALATALLSAIGEVVTVEDEALIDAVTAVSGSGRLYVFYLTECLAAAGVAEGLPPDIAMQLARATVAGAGELMRVTGQPAATLRQNVTSPKGTTYAALQVLMAEEGLEPLMKKAIDAATRRSRELAADGTAPLRYTSQMTSETRERIIEAAFRLAGEKPWPDITPVAIAEAAGLSLAELAAEVSGKPDILDAFARSMDARLLASLKDDPVEGDAHDRLFDIMLRRFELLAPYKTAIANIAKAPADGPAEWLALISSALVTQNWMLTAADINLKGVKGDVAKLGLAKIQADMLRIWLKDDDSGLARTMAALDRKLRDGEALMKRLETPIALCSGFARVFRSFRKSGHPQKAQAHDTAD